MVTIARANWDTGWFQAEIFRILLERLGYVVSEPQKMAPADFYQAAAQGTVAMWPNGWFPLHNSFIEQEEVRWRVEVVGSEVRGGALQGYLIDKRTADSLGITSLDDFTNPDVVSAFDTDGDGKADLTGCDTGWGCEQVIEHHLDAYGLRDTITHVQGTYDDLMSETISRYENGDPIFFYTWTPNWTLGKLIPGRDVVWIEVPFASLPEDQAEKEALTTVEGVPGCVADPCNMGFPPNDIRVVANAEFLQDNPSARRLFELVTIPLVDISVQNARMFEGENSAADIRSHAEEWVANNEDEVNQWLAEATAAEETAPRSAGLLQQVLDRGNLRCGIDGNLPGFSSTDTSGSYSGFNADFCRVIAAAVFGNSEAVEFVPLSIQERFAAVSDRKVDVLFYNTSWIATYDVGMDPPNSGIRLDFGPTIFHSGQGFMVHANLGITSMADLQERSICVLEDTPAEQVLDDQLNAQGISFKKVAFDDPDVLYEVYEKGVCDAVSADIPRLVSRRSSLENPGAHQILGEKISREPLGPVVIEDDSQWRDIVNWSLFATIYAEELGVSRNNVEARLNTDDPDVLYLLGERGSIGSKLGLENNFAFNIIQQVGNYEEIYLRNLGPDTPFDLERGPNKAWNKGGGGVLSSPPLR
jgi:ABC-type proline/glycine betaine transport system substrate-binding protein